MSLPNFVVNQVKKGVAHGDGHSGVVAIGM